MTDDRITVAERYSKATESSNLKVTSERRGDADMLIAAGWAGESLGASLARLRAEFDTVHAQTKGQGNSSATDMLLALMELKSLQRAKAELGAFAVSYATRIGFMRPDAEVLVLAGRVLSAFLDPLCSKCQGRGFIGGGRHEQSGPQLWCASCARTGRRKNRIARDDEQRRFVDGLLAHMEGSSSEFENRVARRLHERSE